MMARVLTASANNVSVAKELVGDDRPLGALITMLASWEEPIRLAGVRALAKITWLVCAPAAHARSCCSSRLLQSCLHVESKQAD